MIRRPPRSTLFPYTRSSDLAQAMTALVVAYPEQVDVAAPAPRPPAEPRAQDRKSTRLNSSHSQISYAVFCLKKKKKKKKKITTNTQETTRIVPDVAR